MINYVKLADTIKYIEHQIKDTEYFMIEPISFLKEAIKARKVIPLFHFDGHATITEAYRTRFEDIRQTVRLSGYFTVPYSLQEYEGTLTNYGVELDKTHITISQAIVYDLEFVDVIQFTAPFQKRGFIEPNFHDHIQIKRNDFVSLYVHKPFLDDMKMYYASDSNPRTIYDKIEVKTEDLHFELSHLKALFSPKDDKMPVPTVTQSDKERIAELESELAQAKAELTEKPEILFKKKGVSPKLLKAKMIADTHAQYLWSKDHDEKIRIGEMYELVWSYLIDTGHGEMLPDRKESLRSWISLIPKHASESGRPPS